MRIIFLSPWFPTPATNGSKIRIYNLLKSLAKEHEVNLVSFVRKGEIIDPKGLDGICATIQTTPWVEFKPKSMRAVLAFASPTPRSVLTTFSRTMEELVEAQVAQVHPEVIVASETATAAYVRDCRAPKVLEDFEAGNVWGRTSAQDNAKRLRAQLTWMKGRIYLGSLLRKFEAVTVVSEQERGIAVEVARGHKNVRLVPNGVDTEQLKPGMAQAEADLLIYNGALTYDANYDAMRFFLEDIFPRILEERPGVRLRVTGSTEGVDTNALPKYPRVELSGFLPDIRPAVAGARACVVPLRVGGGTRLKILEAMALGTPVVATRKGAEGLDVTNGENILIADEPEAFARQVVRLLSDTELRGRLAINARRLVEEKYDWGMIGNELLRIVEAVGNKQVGDVRIG